MSRKILVVDDLAVTRQILARGLSSEYTIVEAANGRDAKEILQSNARSISAVLLDIVMPEMNGYELLRYIKSTPSISLIPVIIVTGTDDADARVKALSLGANDFVTKPYDIAIIKHCLRNNIKLRETASMVNAVQKDKLTGIYNRDAFFDYASKLIKSHEPGYYILTCFDINNFKMVNNQFGSAEGDRILKYIGEKLRDSFESLHGVCCRIAGDIFAGLYPNSLETSEIVSALFGKAFIPDNTLSSITFSVGCYIVSDRLLPVSAIYDRAFLAKQSVKGRYDEHIAYFDDAMLEKLVREQDILSEMDKALEQFQFETWFQPQYNHSTGALIGAEALVRWRHPRRGLLTPNFFIPVFEQNGFIYELDKFVWETVCRYLRKWTDQGRRPLPVSVNLSRYDVFRSDLIEVITGLLERYALPVELLRLEITESAFSKSTEQIVAVAKRLIALGFTVEIDDFGSGYSSLNTLKDVPAQVLKLDMRFLENSENSQRGGNVLESIVRMAKWLNMSVIAEGVETAAQANYLKSIGCNYVQGYLYARPMPVFEYEALAKKIGKEEHLLALETVENLDSNSFWDPRSMETLIFNSFIGGACIYEYYNGKIELLRANDKYSRLFGDAGMSVENALKLSWNEHMDAESSLRIVSDLQASIETRDEVVGEYLFLDLPNCPHKTYIRSTMRVIASAGERFLVYSTNENITEQVTAEQNERRLSEQLEAILANMNGGVTAAYFKDGRRHVLFSNEQYYSLTGYTRAQFEAEVSARVGVILPDDRERVEKEVSRLSASRESGSITYRISRRDGSVRYIQSNISIIDFPDIDAPVQLAVMNDITAQHLLEQKGHDDAAKLQMIMDNVGSGITAVVLHGQKTEFLFANKKYYQLLGYEPESYAEVCAADAFFAVHPSDRESTRALVKNAAKSRSDASLEYRVIRADGALLWLRTEITAATFFGFTDPVLLSTYYDITAEKETSGRLNTLIGKTRGLLARQSTGEDVKSELSRLLDDFDSPAR